MLTFFDNLESGYLVLFWAIIGEELENCNSQVLVLCFRLLLWYVVPGAGGGGGGGGPPPPPPPPPPPCKSDGDARPLKETNVGVDRA